MQKRKSSSARITPKSIAIVLKDHKNVQKMFRDFVKMKREDDSDREDLIERVCKELTVHTRLEEELFYPFAREHLPEPDLIDEASVEHATAKELVAQLEAGNDEEDMRDARFKVLTEYVKHHIQEEEGELFPQLAKAKEAKEPLEVLAEQMQERKLELAQEAGIG